MNKSIIPFIFLFLLIVLSCYSLSAAEDNIEIPFQGNSYTTSGTTDIINVQTGLINDNAQWDKKTIVSIYFRVFREGDLTLSLNYSTDSNTKMKVTVNKKSFLVNCPAGEKKNVSIGKIEKIDPGYVRVDFSEIEKEGNSYPQIISLSVGGESLKDGLCFVDNPDSNFWGRRGPSPNILYTLPEGDVEWFYNEVTVPKGFDPVGSYFEANGFREGYFGMQVNSETERRILFSVWSSFKTDNPNEIPEEKRIILNRKNENTISQPFGNEGAGRQNFMKYNWKAGVTYKFLIRCRPDPKKENCTEYTAYFYSPEDGWMLIASNSRPKTVTYYTQAYSFSENFYTQAGYITRKAYFGNQWAYVIGKGWVEVTKALFSANNGQRMDYKGGVENGRFFLQNCGFFDDYTAAGTLFLVRETKGKIPEINFDKLP